MKLDFVKIDDIDMGDRVREDIGNISELVESFKREGVIQPIAVVENEEGSEKKYLLLAGERRITAAKKMDMDALPARIYKSGLSTLQIKSIEMAENLYRKNFEWQEEVKIKEEIYNLQKEIYGEKYSTSPDAPGVSKRSVAAMLGESHTTLVRDLLLAKAIDVVPDIKKAKTKSDAKKIMEKMRGDIIREEIVKKIEESKSKTSVEIQKDMLTDSFILKDFFEGIKDVPDRSVNIVEIDPPYAIDLKKMKRKDGAEIATLDYNEIDAEKYEEFIDNVLDECYRVMTLNSWLIMWFGPHPWFGAMWKMLTKHGFEGMAIPGIWVKGAGQTMQPGYYLANTYEMFFYVRKGRPDIVQKGRPNIFNYKPVPSQNKVHPTERPVGLMVEILSTFGIEGNTVLVPFLGSGNTLLAANNLSMKGFGYELTKEYKDRFIVKVHEQELGKFK